jgi:2-dehydropantoate 2-reductase
MKRIVVVGVGAIGGWVAASLAQAGHEVSVVARGDTLSAVRDQGLTFTRNGITTRCQVRVTDEPAELGEQDLVFLAVKGPALPALAPRIAPVIGSRSLVVPLLNGVPWWFMGDAPALRSVDPEGTLGQVFPYRQLLGCVIHASASCPQPGHVELRMADRIIVGEPAGGTSERLAHIVEFLKNGGLPAVPSDNVRNDIWYKLWGNMTINPVSALTLATADRILDDPLVERLVLAVMAEARQIGARIDCRIEQSGEERNAVTRKLGAFKSSMLQDVEAGRHLELDALLSAPREIAGRLGLETPWIDALFGLTRLMGSSRELY